VSADDGRVVDADEDAGPVIEPDSDGRGATDSPSGLGRAGWVLVAAVVVAVLVVPGVVYLWPAGERVLGANYRTAMLVFPMIPAVILGIVAVWSMKDRR
jgi:hypothetical protein